MITLKDWLEVIEYKIFDGSDYLWDCYGPNAHRLESWNSKQDGHSLEIIFDRLDQTVYEVCVHDLKNNHAYRMINPSFEKAYKKEAKVRDCNSNQAWDDIEYVDLEVDNDWIEKAKAIIAGTSYDTRVQLELKMSDAEILQLMKYAHEKDMSFNQYIEYVIEQAIEERNAS